MSIASSAATSADWSSACVISSKNPHKFHFLASFKTHLFYSINPTCYSNNLRVFNANLTNFPVIELDLKLQNSPEECPAPTPGAEDSNDFICGLFQNPQTEECAYDHYEKARKKPEFRPNKSTLEQLISDHGDEVAVPAFDSAMRGYNELHMFKSTISVFERMESDGITANSGCYCRIMEAYMKKGDCRKVNELFEEMKSRELDFVPFSTQIYGILCESLCKLGQPFETLEIFRSVTERGVYLESSKIYSLLICSFASIREVGVAEELFEEGESKKLLKDPSLFLKMISMYVEEGLTEKTLGVVKVMKGANIRVSDNICCAVVSGFSRKNRLLTAVKFFEDLVSMGCQPGQVTYASIINVYCRLGLNSKAEMVFEEMEEKGFGKCAVAYSSMVVMYGKTGRPRDAMRLVAKMKERGCKPNVWIYNSLMDMHGRDKNLRQVSKIWTEMKRRKVVPDKVSYTTVISAYNKAGEFEMCMKYYHEFRVHGGVLDKALAGMMVGIFSKTGRIDELVKLLRDMKSEGTALDGRLYRSALNALTDSGLEMQVKWLQGSFKVT
ncbi:hypothetical protein ACFX2I_010781 [Malus domestica]